MIRTSSFSINVTCDTKEMDGLLLLDVTTSFPITSVQ